MSAVFNFLGVLVMTKINSAVASTISNMVDFGGETNEALIALCAALFSIVVYSVAASVFGIPTSESHSLIAGLSGAAIAIHNGVGGINFAEWAKVLYGLVLSLALGFFMGWVICKIITILCAAADRAEDGRLFQGSADLRRCIHEFHARGTGRTEVYRSSFPGDCVLQRPRAAFEGMLIPVWLMLLCSIVMGVGTSVGGEKIIKSVGNGHGQTGEVPGLFRGPGGRGMPPALQRVRYPGVHDAHKDQRHHGKWGAVKRLSAINFGVVKDMMLTWIFTFPGWRADQFRSSEDIYCGILTGFIKT